MQQIFSHPSINFLNWFKLVNKTQRKVSPSAQLLYQTIHRACHERGTEEIPVNYQQLTTEFDLTHSRIRQLLIELEKAEVLERTFKDRQLLGHKNFSTLYVRLLKQPDQHNFLQEPA